jgi:hypothetical protein
VPAGSTHRNEDNNTTLKSNIPAFPINVGENYADVKSKLIQGIK